MTCLVLLLQTVLSFLLMILCSSLSATTASFWVPHFNLVLTLPITEWPTMGWSSMLTIPSVCSSVPREPECSTTPPNPPVWFSNWAGLQFQASWCPQKWHFDRWHVDPMLFTELSRSANLLRHRPRSLLVLYLKSYILPLVDYCDVVWDNCTQHDSSSPVPFQLCL